MPAAVISQTVRQPTTAEIRKFIMTGDFTQGSGVKVHVSLDLLNDSDGTVNRSIAFDLNASAGQKDHFASDVASAMSTIIADVESILGVTFV